MSHNPYKIGNHSPLNLCSLCGQFHGSAVCPMQEDRPSTAVPQPGMIPGRVTLGNATLNGITMGEQAIIDKLDEIIRILQALDTRM